MRLPAECDTALDLLLQARCQAFILLCICALTQYTDHGDVKTTRDEFERRRQL